MDVVRAGQLWESVDCGLCLVVGPNDSTESPGSWVMYALVLRRTFYMHRGARLKGHWVRRTALTAPGEA